MAAATVVVVVVVVVLVLVGGGKGEAVAVGARAVAAAARPPPPHPTSASSRSCVHKVSPSPTFLTFTQCTQHLLRRTVNTPLWTVLLLVVVVAGMATTVTHCPPPFSPLGYCMARERCAFYFPGCEGGRCVLWSLERGAVP